jgi:hypothetical protein
MNPPAHQFGAGLVTVLAGLLSLLGIIAGAQQGTLLICPRIRAAARIPDATSCFFPAPKGSPAVAAATKTAAGIPTSFSRGRTRASSQTLDLDRFARPPRPRRLSLPPHPGRSVKANHEARQHTVLTITSPINSPNFAAQTNSVGYYVQFVVEDFSRITKFPRLE